MTRVLVTGGAGVIGSQLCRSLLSSGHSVVCMDNLSMTLEEGLVETLRVDERL